MALSGRGAADLLLRIPTALFPISLGIAGLGSALVIASEPLNQPALQHAGRGLVFGSAFILTLEAVLYGLKVLRNREGVRDDLRAATRANLLAPGFMAAMVIGAALAPLSQLGGLIWLAASLGHLVLLFTFVGKWLTHDYAPEDLNPTWFLPAAGIMTAPMTWPGIGPAEFPLALFGIGAVLWAMLLPIIFRRLVFEPAVSPELRPTLFIIAAPFGLAANALLTLMPNVDTHWPALLLSGGAFIILTLSAQINFLRRAGISLSWWATTFPIATVAAGLLRLPASDGAFWNYLGFGLLILAGLTTSLATLATVRSAWCTCAKTVSGTERQIAAMQGGHSGTGG